MKKPNSAKKRAELAIAAFADAHEKDVLIELPDFQEPARWEARVERLYRVTILPRLEGKLAAGHRLSRVEQRVLDKARAFLEGCWP